MANLLLALEATSDYDNRASLRDDTQAPLSTSRTMNLKRNRKLKEEDQMNNKIVEEITDRQLKHNVPDFHSGDTVAVSVRIIENKKERIQIYEGVVMQRRGHGVSETFTVRKISSGIGVERTFAVNSPAIAKIDVLKKGKVRRNKITYMRGLSGKAARIKAANEK